MICQICDYKFDEIEKIYICRLCGNHVCYDCYNECSECNQLVCNFCLNEGQKCDDCYFEKED